MVSNAHIRCFIDVNNNKENFSLIKKTPKKTDQVAGRLSAVKGEFCTETSYCVGVAGLRAPSSLAWIKEEIVEMK